MNILKPAAISCIENWLEINDVDDFRVRIFTTVRDMFTIIKNQDAIQSSVESQFQWVTYDESLKAPRIDKLIEKHRSRRLAAI